MTRPGQNDEGVPHEGAKEVVIEFSKSPPRFRWEELTPSQGSETRTSDEPALVRAIIQSKSPSPIPQRIANRYNVVSVLGIGGQAEVYLADDTTLARKVAIKISKPDHLLSRQEQDQFQQEAKAIASLKHPGIVTVHDFGIHDDGRCFIVLEYLSGHSLKDSLKNPETRKTFTLERTIDLISRVAEALHYAHQRGIYHRDLKPGNILLDEHGNPHITDFGLAVTQETQRELKGQIAGTVPYMSPEQIRGEAHWLNGQADIWALGVILYEMLAGQRPFQGRTEEDVKEEIQRRTPTPLRQINDTIPREVEAIVAICLARDESVRYKTGRDVSSDLTKAVERSSAAGRGEPVKPPESTTTPAGKSRVGLAIGIGVLALALPLIVYGLSTGRGWPSSVSESPEAKTGTAPAIEAMNEAKPGPASTVVQNDGPARALLASRPNPLFFDARSGEEPIYSADKQELWFPQIHGDGLWSLGQVAGPASNFTYSVDLEQVPWIGGIGIFFGYHPLENSGGERDIYQAISLEPKIEGSVMRAFSLKRSCVVRQSTGKREIIAVETVESEEVARPDASTLRLVIVATNGKLSQISLGNRLFEKMASEDLQCSLGSLNSSGEYGLSINSSRADGGYGRFRDANFHQP